MEITSETLKSAIAKTLALEYPEYTLYKNKPKKEMQLPCFFIEQLEPAFTKKGHERFGLRSLMTVRLHDGKASRTDLDAVGFNLMDMFSTLYEGDEQLCHGSGIRYEIVDGILHFFVTYSLTVIKPKDGNKMEQIDMKAGVK